MILGCKVFRYGGTVSTSPVYVALHRKRERVTWHARYEWGYCSAGSRASTKFRLLGRSVLRAIDPDKYEVVPIGITKKGAWVTSGDPMAQLRAGGQGDVRALEAGLSVFATDPSGGGRAEIVEIRQGKRGSRELTARLGEALDVIFPVLHGPYGEDGTVQGMLALTGIPYVGSEVLGSAVGMDKITMKSVFRDHGLPVAPYLGVTRAEWERDPGGVKIRAERLMQYPMFAKPSNMGSSVGVGKIHGPEEFAEAITLAARYDRRIIIEQGLDARECECGVLGNDHAGASVVGEVVPGNEFYDYRAKYVDDNSDLVIPAQDTGQSVGGDQAVVGGGVQGPGLRGHGASGLFRGARFVAGVDQRVEYNTGLHPDLDVPQVMGGVGRVLPGADWATDRAGV